MNNCALQSRIEFLHGLLIISDIIYSFNVINENIIENVGFYRTRIKLINGDCLEIFERFEIINECLCVNKYSFHWQTAQGKLIKRWDNAPHHPELATFPHHVHLSDEENVETHQMVDIFQILNIINSEFHNTH
jgi:hypothetical protein